MKDKIGITEEEKKIFYYLNDLREGGVTNMFGASTYIEDEFSLDRRESERILNLWMDNFNENGYEDLIIKDET